MIHSTSIPVTWPQKKQQIESPWYAAGLSFTLPYADIPSKLGMQNKMEAWHIQCNQCNLAAHTDIAHTIAVFKSSMLMVENAFA